MSTYKIIHFKFQYIYVTCTKTKVILCHNVYRGIQSIQKRLFIDTQNCLSQTLTQINVKRIKDDHINYMKEIVER